jgi:hypothetical protein
MISSNARPIIQKEVHFFLLWCFLSSLSAAICSEEIKKEKQEVVLSCRFYLLGLDT